MEVMRKYAKNVNSVCHMKVIWIFCIVAYIWVLSATLTDHRADINEPTEEQKNCQRFAKLKEVFANAQADTKHHI